MQYLYKSCPIKILIIVIVMKYAALFTYNYFTTHISIYQERHEVSYFNQLFIEKIDVAYLIRIYNQSTRYLYSSRPTFQSTCTCPRVLFLVLAPSLINTHFSSFFFTRRCVREFLGTRVERTTPTKLTNLCIQNAILSPKIALAGLIYKIFDACLGEAWV